MRIILDKEAFEKAWNEFFSIDRLDLDGYIEYSDELLNKENRKVFEAFLHNSKLMSDFIYKVDVFHYMYMDFTDSFCLDWQNHEIYDSEYESFKFQDEESLRRSLDSCLRDERNYFLHSNIYSDCELDPIFDDIIDRVINFSSLDETVVKKIDE